MAEAGGPVSLGKGAWDCDENVAIAPEREAAVFEEVATMEFPFEGIPTVPPRTGGWRSTTCRPAARSSSRSRPPSCRRSPTPTRPTGTDPRPPPRVGPAEQEGGAPEAGRSRRGRTG